MNETTTITRFEKALERHDDLRRQMSELEGFIDRELQKPGGEDPLWTEALALHLEILHRSIEAHFQEEERSGFMDALLRESPHLGSDIATWKDAHALILRRLDEIRTDAARRSRGGPDETALSRRTKTVLDLISRHERMEMDLVMKAYSVDLGTGD